MRAIVLAATLLLALASSASAAALGVQMARRRAPRVTLAEHAAQLALAYRGRPYVWGGSGPTGFDCSGFTRFVYGRVRISLPHSSFAQWDSGRPVRRSQLKPGDLVFFAGLSHVGLYLGDQTFIHAPHTGTEVSIASLNDGWYATTYAGAIRVTGSHRPYRASSHHPHNPIRTLTRIPNPGPRGRRPLAIHRPGTRR
jgi:cell wall-associated NlpC family hydrolase